MERDKRVDSRSLVDRLREIRASGEYADTLGTVEGFGRHTLILAHKGPSFVLAEKREGVLTYWQYASERAARAAWDRVEAGYQAWENGEDLA